jgi:uncharacterized protein (DUF427 family)
MMALETKRINPLPGQESVWDYPRPPRLEKVIANVRIGFGGEVIAKSDHAFRVLETSHPPTYYLPRNDVRMEFLIADSKHSYCEFKGIAKYWSLSVGAHQSKQAAWSYPDPTREFIEIKDCLAFYASRVDECWVGEERVQPQAGDFYGGWITSNIVGPFKGDVGSTGW